MDIRVCDAESVGTQTKLLRRLLGRHIQHRRLLIGQGCGSLKDQRRLTDTRISSDEDQRSRNESPAEHSIELRNWYEIRAIPDPPTDESGWGRSFVRTSAVGPGWRRSSMVSIIEFHAPQP